MNISKNLKNWFVAHFIIDIIFATALFFFPKIILNLIGLETAQFVTARLVAAALFAIGITSFLMRNEGKESYQTMLTLKLIWSTIAIIGLIISVIQGRSIALLIPATIFLIFGITWFKHWRELG